MAVSPLTLFWSPFALGLKHDTMVSGPKNDMVATYLLYLKLSLPSGFAPFPQNQACLSSLSLIGIFIKDSSVHQITPSSPGVFIHSFIC